MSQEHNPFDPEFDFLFPNGERDPEKRTTKIRKFKAKVLREIQREQEPETLRERLIFPSKGLNNPVQENTHGGYNTWTWTELTAVPNGVQDDR
jgi:hypothetical protein